MGSLCLDRLGEERKQWRKDHPFGFYAKPIRQNNGVIDLKAWDVGIPGREKTIWEGGLFKLTLTFPDEYPTKPPKCKQVAASASPVSRPFANTEQASSSHHSSTPTFTHPAPFVCQS